MDTNGLIFNYCHLNFEINYLYNRSGDGQVSYEEFKKVMGGYFFIRYSQREIKETFK